VVRPMRSFRRREGRRVVHGALVDRYPEPRIIILLNAKRDVRPPGT
jgi:hypothetical protein